MQQSPGTEPARTATADVAIAGGGVIGLAIAWRAARAGLRTTLFDPAPGTGASHVAAGMLGPAAEAHAGEEPLLRLCLASQSRWPRFAAELAEDTGRTSGYHECGTLWVARDSDENAVLEHGFHLRRQLGLDVERLSARDCRRLEPGLAPAIRGGVLMRGDHQVDPRRLLAALEAACRARGVRLERSRAELVLRGGVAAGLRGESGAEVASPLVIIAAGCWSALVPGLPKPAAPPLHPVKGQILRLRAPAGSHVAGRVLRGLDVYLVPREHGVVVVGSTMEERGFDTVVTAGAVHQLLHDARELVPDVAELELLEASAGLRPTAPDNAPLIGAGDLPGLLFATGHHRNGVLLAPVTAECVLALLRGEQPPEATEAFAPSRFRTLAAVTA